MTLASAIETTEVLNCKMAKVDSSPKRERKESIADLVDDLKFLRVSVDGYREAPSMEEAREERIKELKKANGNLSEVCLNNVTDDTRLVWVQSLKRSFVE